MDNKNKSQERVAIGQSSVCSLVIMPYSTEEQYKSMEV